MAISRTGPTPADVVFWNGVAVPAGQYDAMFTPTLADLISMTGDQTFCSFTVPGGTWRDGEVVIARIIALRKNNTGSPQDTTIRLSFTGAALTTIGGPNTWTDSATEFRNFGHVPMFRGGSSVYVPTTGWSEGTDHQTGSPDDLITNTQRFDSGQGFIVFTPTNFTSDILVTLALNVPVNSANWYFKPRHAACYKTIHWPSFG